MGASRTYRTDAIVLDKTKLKETDLILTLLGEDGRQIRAVAKGARKPGSRLAARCELFCSCDLLLARGRSLDVVTQAELLLAPLEAVADYERLSCASALAEVAKHCSFEDSADPFVYAITEKALALAGDPGLTTPQLDLLVAAFVFKLLSHVGYRPDFSVCVACGDASVSRFSAESGGLLCASCAKSVPGAVEVDAGVVAWLKSLLACTFDDLLASEIDLATGYSVLSLAHLWAATHLDCRLRAMEFLLGR